MVLITGMPRSGTTFIMNQLGQIPGYQINPMSCGPKLRSDEPKLGGVKDVIKLKSTEKGSYIIVKHHEAVGALASYPQNHQHFHKVIYCVRQIDEWAKSARKHGNMLHRATKGSRPYWMKYPTKGSSDPLKFYGEQYRAKTLEAYMKTPKDKAFYFDYSLGGPEWLRLLRFLGLDTELASNFIERGA